MSCNIWWDWLPFGLDRYLLGFGPLGNILGLLLFFLTLYFIIKLVMSFLPKTNADLDKNHSLEILKARYAKGEITAEDYKRMRDLLAS